MAGTTLHSPHVLIFVSLYCYQFKVFTDCCGWGVATFRDQNTDIIVIISLSCFLPVLLNTNLCFALSALASSRLVVTPWRPLLVRADNPISANQFLHPAASLSVEQTSKQSKQNVQYLSQYRGSIILVLFFAHSSLSAGSCHSAPVTGNPRQSEAMSPQQLATCRQWPGPTVASLLGALSCSHRSDLGLKFLLYLQSHIWCLQ